MVCTWIASRQRCCVSVVGDRVLYVWFFDHIGVFVVVFVFVFVFAREGSSALQADDDASFRRHGRGATRGRPFRGAENAHLFTAGGGACTEELRARANNPGALVFFPINEDCDFFDAMLIPCKHMEAWRQKATTFQGLLGATPKDAYKQWVQKLCVP